MPASTQPAAGLHSICCSPLLRLLLQQPRASCSCCYVTLQPEQQLCLCQQPAQRALLLPLLMPLPQQRQTLRSQPQFAAQQLLRRSASEGLQQIGASVSSCACWLIALLLLLHHQQQKQHLLLS